MANQPHAQLVEHDVLDAFESAAASARIAAAEFADAAEKYGRNVALKRFNAQVSFWSNRFTNRRYRRFVYTMGSLMDGEAHTFTPSLALIIKRYRERHPGKTISPTTIKKYADVMAAYGIMDVIRRHQDSEDEHPGAQKTNEYRVHFDRVLVHDQVVPHDFTQVSPSWTADGEASETDISNSRNETGIGSGIGGGIGSGIGGGPLTYSSTLPGTSLPTSSHTAEDEQTSAREDPGGDEETATGDIPDGYPAHLVRRNTFKLWTAKSRKVVWYNLDRAGKAPADARTVLLYPAEAEYFWTGLKTGDQDQDYAARRTFLLASPDVRAEKVFRWRNAAEIEAQERRELEEAAGRQAQAEREAARAALRAEFDRLSARYDELTGRPGAADYHLGSNLRGPNGMPRLSVQVEHLREYVDQMEYYQARKDDPPWSGEPSTLIPDSGMTSARGAGKIQGGFVSPDGKVRQTYGRSDIKPGEVFGYFRWTEENGLEVVDPAEAEAEHARKEADREAERQAKADKEALAAERAGHLKDLLDQYHRVTDKFLKVDPRKGYDAMVEQLTQQIEAAQAARASA